MQAGSGRGIHACQKRGWWVRGGGDGCGGGPPPLSLRSTVKSSSREIDGVVYLIDNCSSNVSSCFLSAFRASCAIKARLRYGECHGNSETLDLRTLHDYQTSRRWSDERERHWRVTLGPRIIVEVVGWLGWKGRKGKSGAAGISRQRMLSRAW
jgi:hypothetical protein